jgi:hypothetical protein
LPLGALGAFTGGGKCNSTGKEDKVLEVHFVLLN